MAGVEFKKYGTLSLSELGVHFDNEIRSNPNVAHSNKTIDITKTQDNYYIGKDSWNDIIFSIGNKIQQADENNPPKRIKQDRKVFFSLEVPCPPELEGTDKEDIFFQKVYEMYSEYMPGLVGGVIHKDEKHEYYDSKKKELITSRNHGHFFGACITEDGRCNAKDSITRELCQRVNNDIQQLCLNEFDISYQTGEGRKGEYKTVEQLKQESHVAFQKKCHEENLENIEELRKEKKILDNEIIEREQIKDIQDKEICQKEEYLNLLSDKEKSLTLSINEKQTFLEKINKIITTLIPRFNDAYIKIQRIFEHWNQSDGRVYEEILRKTNPIMQKGNRARKVIENKNNQLLQNERITKVDIYELDDAHVELREATESLEELEDEYDFEL